MNKAQLKTAAAAAHTTNGVRGNTAANIRVFNNSQIDAMYLNAASSIVWPGPVSTIPVGWHIMDGSEYSQTDYADLFANLGGPSSPYGVGTTTFQIPLMKGGQTIIQCGISAYVLNIIGTPAYEMGAILKTNTPTGGIAATFKVIGTGSSFALKLLTSGNGYVNGQQYTLRLLDESINGQMITITSTYNLAATGGEEKHTQTEAEMFRHTHVQDAHSHMVQHSTGTGTGQGAIGGVNPNLISISTSNVTATNQNTGNGQAFNVMNPYVAMNYIIKLY